MRENIWEMDQMGLETIKIPVSITVKTEQKETIKLGIRLGFETYSVNSVEGVSDNILW